MAKSKEHTDKLTAPADFKGPSEDRKCTDVLCFLILIAAWAAMTALGGYAVRNGDYRILVRPMDYDGQICGISEKVKDYPYLYPVNYYGGGVCVDRCPSLSDPPADPFTLVTYGGIFQLNGSTIDADEMPSVADYSNSSNLRTCTVDRCFPNGNVVLSWTSEGINEGAGYAFYATDTSSYMNRCFMTKPALTALKNATTNIVEKVADDSDAGRSAFTSNLYSDIYTARLYIFGFGLGVAVVVGFIYLSLMRIPGVLCMMVWGSIFGALCMFALIGRYALKESESWRLEDPRNHTDNEIRALQIFAYCAWGAGGAFFLLMCFLRKRIQLALGLVRESAKAIAAVPALTVFPVLQCGGLIIFLVAWLYYAVHLGSLGAIVPKTIEVNNVTLTFRSFEYDPVIERSGWYLLFCFFWTSQFIIALGEIIVAMVVSKWFFSRNKSAIGNATVLRSIGQTVFYHSGTAAFGSLIIAIISTIRAFLMYLQNHAKKSGSRVAQAILCCLQCFMWCVEKFMKFLNKNAYIQTAIFGTSFCASAKGAFFLILRNAARMGTLGVISDVVVVVGKIFISIITGGCSYFLIDQNLGSDIYSPIGPVIFVTVLAYFAASMFMNVFSMVISTLLQCFIADEEMFNGSDEAYASKSLRAYVDKNGAPSVKAVKTVDTK